MRSKGVVVIVVTRALAGAFFLGGCGSATTRSPTAVGSTVGAAPPAGGSAVNLVAYSDNDGFTSTVILTGAIGDFGDAVSVSASGAVDDAKPNCGPSSAFLRQAVVTTGSGTVSVR